MIPIFTLEMTVRWREMDALGHVNNAQYLSYVEEARVNWFKSMRSDWDAQPASPVVAAIHIDFRKPIHWPEAIEVRLLAAKKGSKSVTIGHQIVSAGNPACVYAEGYTVLVWINREGQAVLPPDYVSALFE